MADITIVATSPTYVASLGAMIDAHARLGEVFQSNEALGGYATMQTRLLIAGARPGPILLAGGQKLGSALNLADLARPRLIYLPSFQVPDTDRFVAELGEFAQFHQWLFKQGRLGVPIGGCGASALHLAAAGLLDQQDCAINPRLVGALRKIAPRVRADADQPLCRSGSIWTCNRDVDNAALVSRMLSEAFSPLLGQGLAMREPPGAAAEALVQSADPMVAQAQMWIRDRFTRQFRIADLAQDLGVSHQTLIRRFEASGSSSPREFVQRTRVSAAASMLSETARSITEIAQLVGYTDVPSFRSVFVKLTGLSPGSYRREQRMNKRSNEPS